MESSENPKVVYLHKWRRKYVRVIERDGSFFIIDRHGRIIDGCYSALEYTIERARYWNRHHDARAARDWWGFFDGELVTHFDGSRKAA